MSTPCVLVSHCVRVSLFSSSDYRPSSSLSKQQVERCREKSTCSEKECKLVGGIREIYSIPMLENEREKVGCSRKCSFCKQLHSCNFANYSSSSLCCTISMHPIRRPLSFNHLLDICVFLHRGCKMPF